MTLVIIHDHEKILLGLKKRGFGAGRWNGFGGKVQDGENVEQSALRELQEEVGVVPQDLRSRGQIVFSFETESDDLEVNIFSANNFSGEVVESEEMMPQWFLHEEIPYSQMWADDPHWLPLVLNGKNVKGRIHFDNPDNQNILDKLIEVYE